MNIVKDKRQITGTIEIDGCHFIGCYFEDCDIAYSGGAFKLEHTAFKKCRVQVGGAAARTVRFLDKFGIINEGDSFHLPMYED